MYNIILTDEDGYSHVFFTTYDLAKAEEKIAFIVESSAHPNLLFNSPVYKSVELQKSEVISRFDMDEA
jgi:hypothetical protein